MALNQEQANEIKTQLFQQLSKFPEDQVKTLKEQIENATSEQLEKLISSQQEHDGGKCLFCEIASGNVETIKLHEDSAIFVMMDISPASSGHIIIIPKQHYQFIFQVPDQILWDMIKTAKMIIPSLVNAVKSKGFNILISQGVAGGQRINHFSLNIIPRYENDGISFEWQRKTLLNEQKAVAEKLKEVFSKIGEEVKTSVIEKKEEKVETKKKPEEGKENKTESLFFPRRMP